MSKFKSKILIIEDDKDLNELLALRLGQDYEIYSIFDFIGVEDLLVKNNFDLLLVDRNLPSGDSVKMVQNLRKQGFSEAVIFLTAKVLHTDLLDGFESGCDDYICKPFDFNELLLRIKAVIRRGKKDYEKLKFKDFVLDFENCDLFYKDEKIELSSLEFELLKCFFQNPNILLNRQFLSENVWQKDFVSDKTINIALSRLRNKIPQIKENLQSVRGVGYKLC